MTKANRPVYGTAEKAGFMKQANDLALSSMEALKQKLGASGATDSGRMFSGLQDLELGRMGNIINFLGQIPYLNEQARSQKMANLLGLGTSWAGKAPIDTQTTGSSVMDMLSNLFSSSNLKTTESMPWYSGLLTGASGLLGDWAKTLGEKK